MQLRTFDHESATTVVKAGDWLRNAWLCGAASWARSAAAAAAAAAAGCDMCMRLAAVACRSQREKALKGAGHFEHYGKSVAIHTAHNVYQKKYQRELEGVQVCTLKHISSSAVVPPLQDA